MIGRNGERRSGISAQAARHDDDDDDIHPFNGCRDLNSSTKRFAIAANGNMITSSPENSTPRG